ncbi:MAG TPA: sigma 54-interacting transcriptional regulator [Polyangiaceae bacterium]
MSPASLEPTALERIALQMTGTLALDDVLSSVTDGLVHDLDVALARVWLLESGDELHLRASSGLSTRLDGAYARVPVGSRKIGRIAETGEPMATNDAQHDARIPDTAWAREQGIVSFAGWPLKSRGELVGVLGTFSRRERTDAELARMGLFASQAAIAIQNARLFATVRALDERLQAENAYLRREIAGDDEPASELLARCPGLAPTLAAIRQVAPTTTTVLLHGETGTGKELVARALHELGPRRTGPLVRLNCAALSPSLFESELFGHEKGAFTGAQQRRPGRFELADGGTLLLDEVGEIPPELQPKLLRVLQEREVERVGGGAPVKVDVRIVAATNRDLGAAVAAGRFRQDLYYRLAVFPVEVPPLRGRVADIRPLAQGFVRANARRLGKALEGVTPEALARLEAHDWPGNVRELANVIERAAIVATGGTITGQDLALAPRASSSPAAARPDGGTKPATDSTGEGPDRLEDVERAHIVRILERAGWTIEGKSGAATVLGLAPSTLRSRMAQLGIARRDRR